MSEIEAKAIVRRLYPEANACEYAGMGWFVISRRGTYSLEREGWLGEGETEHKAWLSAAMEIQT